MPSDRFRLDRRSFLGVSAGAGLLCTLEGVPLSEATKEDVAASDATARSMRKPPGAKAAANEFPTPVPQPGGKLREYWVQARPRTWNIAPETKTDEWMKKRITGRRSAFRGLVYQRMTAGFAAEYGPPAIPGPILRGEVGDVIKVHFRNADSRFEQALTMHPHGVRYNPEYDGSYLGDFTRAGGFIEPGEEFTYLWECTPDSVGVWPYHDHGPNHTLNTMRGLFGALVITEKGEKLPDVEQVLFLHALLPNVTNLDRAFQAMNGRVGAGNTPHVKAKVGQDVAFHVIGMDNNFHTFHIHGHRWKDTGGAYTDCPTVGPNETITARFVEDNPGRWLYHCHVFSHQTGMAGWYDVSK
jgi:FtsP/CotA-like multicopper oxidase with cupredoxin domain